MRTNRWQISLRQALILTGLLSVVFALAGPGKMPLSETLLLVASCGVAMGLRQQGRDIGRAMIADEAPSDPNVLRAWRFEKNWRTLFASLVFFGWLLAALNSQGIFGSANRQLTEILAVSLDFADALVLLVVVVGLASSVVRWRGPPQTPFAAWVHRAGWVAGVALLLIVTLRETAVIQALVHMAIRGIEMAQPLPYGETFYPGGVRLYESRVSRFGQLQLVLAGAVLLNLTMLIRMTDRPAKRWSRVGYAFSFAVALGVVLWNQLFGFASVSPVIASVQSFWMGQAWRQAIPLMFLFGFAATYCLLSHPVQPLGDGPNWRPTGRVYVSESWWVIAVAAIGSVWHGVTNVYYYVPFMGSAMRAAIVASVEILASPSHYLHLAVVAACVQLAIVRLRGRPLVGQGAVELNLSRFASTWIAVAMTTYVTLEAAFGTSFVYWIVPWEPLPLF